MLYRYSSVVFILSLLLFTVNVKADSGLISAYDAEELECLALNIYHEARGEEDKNQDLVAIVTLNRVLEKDFPSTICDVVWDDSQFSWTQDGLSDTPHNIEVYSAIIDKANLIMYQYMLGTADTMDNALYYHKFTVKPRWDYSKLTLLGQYGKHILYKDS